MLWAGQSALSMQFRYTNATLLSTDSVKYM